MQDYTARPFTEPPSFRGRRQTFAAGQKPAPKVQIKALKVLTAIKTRLYCLALWRGRKVAPDPKATALWALFKNQQVICVGTRVKRHKRRK